MLLLLLACTPAPSGDTDSSVTSSDSDDGSSDSAPDSDTGSGEGIHPDAPVVRTCDAWCYLHETGDQNYIWKVECAADDPQGLDTIGNGRLEIQQNQQTFATDLVACDGAGFCSTQFGEPTHDVWCDQAPSYTFLVYISDVDEHESAPYVVKGRAE
ncbi:MAG: hypothetical protein GY913_10395 [Proteobacteria bacterium]|nr:hypothetical protein [Pseudomonadota bacterium]MCP4917322.1 hypothetical protein [Pseudomonadota bacterium]